MQFEAMVSANSNLDPGMPVALGGVVRYPKWGADPQGVPFAGMVTQRAHATTVLGTASGWLTTT